MANELDSNYSISAVVLAYVMPRHPGSSLSFGGRKVEKLKDNIRALEIKLIPAQIKELESATSFDLGFPLNFVGEDPKTNNRRGGPLLGPVCHMAHRFQLVNNKQVIFTCRWIGQCFPSTAASPHELPRFSFGHPLDCSDSSQVSLIMDVNSQSV